MASECSKSDSNRQDSAKTQAVDPDAEKSMVDVAAGWRGYHCCSRASLAAIFTGSCFSFRDASALAHYSDSLFSLFRYETTPGGQTSASGVEELSWKIR